MEASAQWAVRRRRKRPEAVSAQRSVGPAPRGRQAYWANGTRAKAGTRSRDSSTQQTERRQAAGTRRAYGRTAAKSRTRSRPLFGQAMRPQARGRRLCRWKDGAEPEGTVQGDGRVGRAGRRNTRKRPRLPGRHAFTPGRREQPGGRAKAAGAAGVGLWRRKKRRTGGNRAGPADGWGGLNRSRRRTRPRRPGRPFLRGMPRTRAAGPGADEAARAGEGSVSPVGCSPKAKST